MIGAVVPPSPARGVGAIVTAIKTDIRYAVEEGREFRVQTVSAGCPDDAVNPLDGSSPAPDAGGLEIGSVVTGIGDGVAGVSGDLAVGATCYDGDGRGGATATCPERGGGFSVAPETSFGASGALAVVAGPEAAVVTAHVVAGYESGVEPGGRYEGGTMPSAFGPVVLGFSYDPDTGLVTWDTSGGVSASIGGVGAVALSGSMSLPAGAYTLTVTGTDGSTVTATATVPVAPVRTVLVDSVGNVYLLTESGGTWSATWYSTTSALGAALPVPKAEVDVFIELDGGPTYKGWLNVDGADKDFWGPAVDEAAHIPETDVGASATGDVANARVRTGGVISGPALGWDVALKATGSATKAADVIALGYVEAPDPIPPGFYGYSGPATDRGVYLIDTTPGISMAAWGSILTAAHHCIVGFPAAPWHVFVEVRQDGSSVALHAFTADAITSGGVSLSFGAMSDVTAPPVDGNTWVDPVWFRGGTLSPTDVLTYT